MADSASAPEPERPRPLRPLRPASTRIRAAWTVGLALVAVAGVVLGLVIWQDPSRSSDRAAAGLTPRPSATGVVGELDQATRQATIGEASMSLPLEPYELRVDPMRAKGLFDNYFAADAIVHEDYRGRSDWAAVVGLAQVAPVATRNDLQATAVEVTNAFARQFFDNRPTTVMDLSVDDHSIDGCSGILLTTRVTYRIEGLASSSDELTVLVVRLDDGTKVAAFSSIPADAPAGLHAQAREALESVHVG